MCIRDSFFSFPRRVDEFELTATDVGFLYKIEVCHDNTGFFPGWFLNKVSSVHAQAWIQRKLETTLDFAEWCKHFRLRSTNNGGVGQT